LAAYAFQHAGADIVGFEGTSGSVSTANEKIQLPCMVFEYPIAQSWDQQNNIQLEANKAFVGGVMPSHEVPRTLDNVIDHTHFLLNENLPHLGGTSSSLRSTHAETVKEVQSGSYVRSQQNASKVVHHQDKLRSASPSVDHVQPVSVLTMPGTTRRDNDELSVNRVKPVKVFSSKSQQIQKDHVHIAHTPSSAHTVKEVQSSLGKAKDASSSSTSEVEQVQGGLGTERRLGSAAKRDVELEFARSLTPLSKARAASLAAAKAWSQNMACGLNGARAVDDLLDSAMFIWAAVERCQEPVPGGSGNVILCSLDVSSAIESVNAMMNVVLKAIRKCGHLEGYHPKCGLAVGVLTKSFAGLAAASSGIVAKCPNALNHFKPLEGVSVKPLPTEHGHLGDASSIASNATGANIGKCFVDIKDIAKSVFKATKRIMTLRESCPVFSRHCTHNAIKIAASLAAIGEYIAGAIGRCIPLSQERLADRSECAAQSLHIFRSLADVGRASLDMSRSCEEDSKRLYQIEDGNETHGSSFTFALAVLLPITLVLSFFSGSTFAKICRSPDGEHELLAVSSDTEWEAEEPGAARTFRTQNLRIKGAARSVARAAST